MIEVSLCGSVGGFALDATFSVPAQGVTAIWGPSGSGKTTLLRAIAGLVQLNGRVRIGDAVWQDDARFTPVHQRRIGYVFQEPSLLSHLSVQGNLDYARYRSDAAVDFDKIVAQTGIDGLLGRGVTKLSGGERQRVAIARTLLSAPDVLLMDEPLSSLDGDAKAGLIPVIAAIGKTLPVLYVSHDAFEIERLADRVLRLSKGRLIDVPETDFATEVEGLSEAELKALARAALKAGIRV
ncbi:molybdenum import ATP-binding protein modC 1 [Asticcacaulis biprosthecium C19]|uniref:Molybdenum import ATP-binding protein modC 1 n=1 Tax=Asticcacaulis biprosthecium C19 TaxID=715226 RepID=F4QRS6_9CAUL|nr:ATP-binding cassette domain-containing protein [Asticcacaulis biprosthecium]EGF89446.1 molybdenum import ATP-binding protein modC 1 [Asticcacaulis biprosthecium C19]